MEPVNSGYRTSQRFIYFHMHLSPLVPAPSGNHFGFLEPLLTCQFKLEVNSIKEMASLVSATKESLEVALSLAIESSYLTAE